MNSKEKIGRDQNNDQSVVAKKTIKSVKAKIPIKLVEANATSDTYTLSGLVSKVAGRNEIKKD